MQTLRSLRLPRYPNGLIITATTLRLIVKHADVRLSTRFEILNRMPPNISRLVDVYRLMIQGSTKNNEGAAGRSASRDLCRWTKSERDSEAARPQRRFQVNTEDTA